MVTNHESTTNLTWSDVKMVNQTQTQTQTTNQPALPLIDVYTYLDRAEQLLRAPSHHNGYQNNHSWIQGCLAIDHEGLLCAPESDLAVAYCEIGAVKAVTFYAPNPEQAYQYVVSVLHAANPRAIKAIHYSDKMGGIPTINDHATSFDTIIKMFQRAKLWVIKQGNLEL